MIPANKNLNKLLPREGLVNKALFGFGGVVAIVANMSCAQAADTVKIGLILPYTGQFADTATQIDNGIKLYIKEHGDSIAGKKIEIIRKDVTGVAPDIAKRLATELITRDNVDVLAGFVLTPNAIAASDVSKQAKKFMVIMNAATSIITLKSPYSVRVSLTLPQITETLGAWAAKNGPKQAYTMVSDYGPGHDAEQGFQRAFKAGGGTITGEVRMAVANPDFSAYVQRMKDLNPPSAFIFVPGGEQPAAIGKTMAQRGVSADKIKLYGTGEFTSEAALKNMGDAALGIVTAWHYDANHDSKMNKEFVKNFKTVSGDSDPDFFSVGGYDGMHVIYETLKKTNGDAGGDALIAAAKGMAWESPRGPVSIDPDTRDIIQTVYIRRVQKVDGKLENVEFDKIADVKDPVKAAMKK